MSKDCPYCKRSKPLLNDCENGGPSVYIDNGDGTPLTVSTEGYDYEIPINYCPMCGKRLGDTDA
jgi:glutaredoxin